MTGSSSTWYAISARCSVSRSSAARVSALETAKKPLCRVDDRVGLLALELRAVVDAPPRHCDRVHLCGLRSTDIERRVADVRAVRRLDVHALCGQQQRLGIGLVLFRLV